MSEYLITVFWSDEDRLWVADIPDLKYCSAFGDNPMDALSAKSFKPRTRGSNRRPGLSTLTSASKTRPGSSPRPASSMSRSNSARGSCCAATSTGSMSPRPEKSGSSTTRRAQRRERSVKRRRFSK